MVRHIATLCFLITTHGLRQEPAATLQITLPKGVVFQARYIPSGDAFLGAKDEPPIMQFVQGFWLGRTEVTLGQWQAFMGGPALASAEAKLPVSGIRFDEIEIYLKKLNQWSNAFEFRLPTAAEWEHACRTGRSDPFQAGRTLSSQEAHFLPQKQKPASVMGPRPVGERSANAWGLVDMHGNVAEWVVAASSGPGMAELRGGSFQTNAEQCACGYRVNSPRSTGDLSVGFRLVIQEKHL